MNAPPDPPPHEFAARRAHALELAAARGLAGLVVWSRNATTVDWYGDVLYLTNHHTPFPQLPDNPPTWAGRAHSVLVLSVDDEPTLVIDSAEYRADLATIDDVRVDVNVPRAVASVLREKRLTPKPLGLVGRESVLLSSHAILLEELAPMTVDLRPADDILALLRRRKSNAELELVRHAASVGIRCMNAMMEAVEPGMTEGDIVGEGLRLAASLGAFPYDVAVASGPHSSNFQWARLPSWDVARRLAEGDLMHIDFWGPVRGYFTDFVRSTVVGDVVIDNGQRELLNGAIEFVEHIIAGIRPDVSFHELWRQGNDWLTANGFAEKAPRTKPSRDDMFPGFGHCIGLGVEPPYIMEGVEDRIEEGMVIAVEILLSRVPVGGAGFEQNVIVTPSGCDVITAPCPARWWSHGT